MKLLGIELTRGLLILNTLEVIGLALWLYFATPAISAVGLVAIGVLLVFLAAEHVVGFNNFHGQSLTKLKGLPLVKLAGITILETVVHNRNVVNTKLTSYVPCH